MRRLAVVLSAAVLVSAAVAAPATAGEESSPGPSTGSGQMGSHAAVAVGDHHICGLNDAGRINCWGADGEGQSSEPRGDESLFRQVVAAGDHTCGLTADSLVRCWGDDSAGQVASEEEIAALGRVLREVKDAVTFKLGTSLTSATAAFSAGDVGRLLVVPSGPNRGIYAITAFDSPTSVTVDPEFPASATGLDVGVVDALDTGDGTFSRVMTTDAESCAIRTDGGISCWGTSATGALIGPMASTSTYRDLAVGPDSVCAITTLGSLDCWGGASGDGTDAWISGPAAAPGTYLDVAVVAGATCAITAGHDIACWSEGDGHTQTSGVAYSQLSATGSMAGTYSICRLTNGGVVACDGDVAGEVPVGSFVSVTTGPGTACGVETSGELRCWGDDSSQQITELESGPGRGLEVRGPFSDGTTTAGSDTFTAQNAGWTKEDVGRFVSVGSGADVGVYEVKRVLDERSVQVDRAFSASGEDVTYGIYDRWSSTFSLQSVSAGAYHTCAIDSLGHVACFGRDLGGSVSKPNQSDSTYVSVASGRAHSCAVRSDGALDCWGNDTDGSVDGPNADGRTFTSVSASRATTCAITDGGRLACWGTDSEGAVSGPNGYANEVLQVSTGDHHTCAVTTGGSLHCWGSDTYGEVDGPNAAAGPFVAVAAGWYHTCALTDDADIKCWGDDQESMVSGPNQSTDVFRELTVGVHHTCAVLVSGRARCWGSQEAEIADVNADTDVVESLSAGWYHTCGVLVSGAVRCWGQDDYGQIGEAPGFAGAAPTTVRALSKVDVKLGASGSPTPAVAVATGMLPRGLSVTVDGRLQGIAKETGRFQGTIQALSTEGIAVLPYDLTVKRARSTVQVSKVRVRSGVALVSGSVEPGKRGLSVKLSLQKKRAGAWVEASATVVKVRAASIGDRDRDGRKDIAFRARLRPVRAGDYRVVASLRATRLIEPSAAVRSFHVR